MAYCSNCGNEVQEHQAICLNCGAYVQHSPARPGGKSRIAAGIIAILLGGLGVHKFYMGKTGLGVVYLLLCWTFVPSIVGLIEGIIYLCEDDAAFQKRLHGKADKAVSP